VHLDENVWIGERAALLAGTRVGKNSVVGFGAICMRGYPENVIIVGNPARVSAPIAPVEEFDPLDQSSQLLQNYYVTRGYLTGRREA
jgi:acetyltransferase-like isoleucine patch superfamily enzyme